MDKVLIIRIDLVFQLKDSLCKVNKAKAIDWLKIKLKKITSLVA